jgi:AcrR family transcriptional regulator
MTGAAQQRAFKPKESGAALSYADSLAAALAGMAARKGERTRAALKAAAARVLETSGYRDMRVTDVNERAGVSNALFYVYFKNKELITNEVLCDFLAFMARQSDPRDSGGGLVDAIYRANLTYIKLFEANPGLMRCLFQFGDEFPAFAETWRQWNNDWLERVVRALRRDPALAQSDADDLTVSVTALGLMLDGLLRLSYVEREPTLRALAPLRSPEALAELVTRLWAKALYGAYAFTPPG